MSEMDAIDIVLPGGVAGSVAFEFAGDIWVEADRANPRVITGLHAPNDSAGIALAKSIWPDISVSDPDSALVQGVEAMELGRWIVAADYFRDAAPGTVTAYVWAVDLAQATLNVVLRFPQLRAAEACAALVEPQEGFAPPSPEPQLVSSDLYSYIADYVSRSIDDYAFIAAEAADGSGLRGYPPSQMELVKLKAQLSPVLSLLRSTGSALRASLTHDPDWDSEVPETFHSRPTVDLDTEARADLVAGVDALQRSKPQCGEVHERAANFRSGRTKVAGTLRRNDLQVSTVGHQSGQWRSRIRVVGPGVNGLELWMKAYDEQDSLVAMAPIRWLDECSGSAALVLAPQTVPQFVLTDTPHLEQPEVWLRASAQAGRHAGSVRAGKTDRDAWLEIASLWKQAGDPDRAWLACQMGLVPPEHRMPDPPMISPPVFEPPAVDDMYEAPGWRADLEPWGEHSLIEMPTAESELERLAGALTQSWAEERKFWDHDPPFLAERIQAGLFRQSN